MPDLTLSPLLPTPGDRLRGGHRRYIGLPGREYLPAEAGPGGGAGRRDVGFHLRRQEVRGLRQGTLVDVLTRNMAEGRRL